MLTRLGGCSFLDYEFCFGVSAKNYGTTKIDSNHDLRVLRIKIRRQRVLPRLTYEQFKFGLKVRIKVRRHKVDCNFLLEFDIELNIWQNFRKVLKNLNDKHSLFTNQLRVICIHRERAVIWEEVEPVLSWHW